MQTGCAWRVTVGHSMSAVVTDDMHDGSRQCATGRMRRLVGAAPPRPQVRGMRVVQTSAVAPDSAGVGVHYLLTRRDAPTRGNVVKPSGRVELHFTKCYK